MEEEVGWLLFQLPHFFGEQFFLQNFDHAVLSGTIYCLLLSYDAVVCAGFGFAVVVVGDAGFAALRLGTAQRADSRIHGSKIELIKKRNGPQGADKD